MADFQQIPGGNNFMLKKVQYTASQARGVAVEVIFSWFSAAAVVGLLGVLAISAWNTRKSVNPHLFVRSHVAVYFVSLLWCDLLQAFASMLSVRWLSTGAVTMGPYCTYQGFLKQSADVSMAIWTVLIALHTFLVVFLRWHMPQRSLLAMLAGGWGFVLLIVIIGPAGYKSNQGPFYAINGYYCWISSNYGNQRITLDLMWLFIGASLSFLLYGLIFLNLRGNVTTSGIRLRRDSRTVKMVDEDSVAVAKQMLIYPVAFTILIFPMAIVRFIMWSGHAVTDAGSTFGDTVFLMSGLVDVVLFVLTRRVLPEHSVIPKGYRIHFWRKKDGGGGNSGNSRPVIDLDEDLEKGDVTDKAAEANLDENIFRRAESPDDLENDYNQVTIRVQSQVIDRIHLQPGYEGPASPPGLPSPSGRMEDISLDSSRGIRVSDKERESEFFASDLPPLPPSAYTARGSPAPGSGLYADTPARTGTPLRSGRCNEDAPTTATSARSARYPQDEYSVPEPPRSPRYAQEELCAIPSPVRSPRPQQNEFSTPKPPLSARYAEEISSPVRSARQFEDVAAPSPQRSARYAEDDSRIASPLRSVRDNNETYAPSPLRSVRTPRYEDQPPRIPTPVQSAHDDFSSSIPTVSSAAAPSSESPYYVGLPAPSPHLATPEVRTADPGVSQFRCRSPLLSSHDPAPSPTDSSRYTESDDDEPYPSALSPAPYHQYLGTPRSATFPRPTPSSAREINFPMSARLPSSDSRWPRY